MMSVRETMALCHKEFPQVIHQFNLKIGAEIGVAYGDHSTEMFVGGGAVKIYGIDSYQHRPEYENDGMCRSQEEFDKLYDETKKLMADLHGSKFSLIRASSEEGAKLVPNDLDFVYIDAEHTLEAVRKDIALWYPKVRSGGILGGHDFGQFYPGVVDAVVEFAVRENLFLHVESHYHWWILKR